MKRFRLIEETSRTFKKEDNPAGWEADRVDYITCVRECMRRPLNPQAGTDFDEMQKALRVLKLLDGKKLGDLLELEDEDHRNLAERARTQRWPVNDDRLVRFVKTVLDAGEWPLDEWEPDEKEKEEAGSATPERVDGIGVPV